MFLCVGDIMLSIQSEHYLMYKQLYHVDDKLNKIARKN